MKNFTTYFQHLFPQHLISRLVGRLFNSRNPYVKQTIINWFIRRYGVDMSLALQPNPAEYTDFNHFFTRVLKAGARPIEADPKVIICPVDGAISQLGPIKGDRIFQAKGFDFDLQTLLGGVPERAAPFQDGEFATIYLAPKDYHRIHMPLTGTLREMVYIPGKLFSVNPRTAATVPNLFARNERVVALFDTELGPMAMVLVGAIIVASIDTVWHGVVTPPRGKKITTWNYPQSGEGMIKLERGAEMGHFKLGSTVILLFGPQVITWATGLQARQNVQLGSLLAHRHTSTISQHTQGDLTDE